MPKSVAIYDPQYITRQGFSHMLDAQPRFDEVNVVEPDQHLLTALTEYNPDFLVIDYLKSEQVGIDTWRIMRHKLPDMQILVISDDNDKARIQTIIKTGIRGFLTKSCSGKEILQAIETIDTGGKFFCQKVVNIITAGQDFTYSELTEREIEIVKAIASGKSSAQIARHLIISVHTVNSHRKNILKKLGLKSPTELIIYAAEQGWISTK